MTDQRPEDPHTAGATATEPESSATSASGTGFPAETPVADMTTEQQVAYWKHQSRKHESTVKSLGDIEELKNAKAELERVRQEQLSESEKAIEAAREEGRKAGRAESQPKLVESTFRGVGSQKNLSDDQVNQIVAGINHTAFLTDTGEVDTDKVNNLLAAVAPAEDPTTGLYNTGGGHREHIQQTGREEGLAEAERRFGTK